MDRMLKGKIQMGNNAQSQTRWDQDALSDCSPEDQVFGWAIRSSEVLHCDRSKINDEVLCKMLYQGLLDKKAGGPAWTEPLNIKHGVRFMSSVVVRVLQRIFQTDAKVSRVGLLSSVSGD